MHRQLNEPAPSWQQVLITIALCVGVFAGVAAIVSCAALLERTCVAYDLTGQEAKCGSVP